MIEGMIENYEDLADAVEEYEQALEDAEDIQNEIQDAFYEWQDLNAEMLSYELELKLQVNDRELAKIERAINRISDDFYQRAEAAAMMIGGGAGGSSQYSTYMSRLNELESQYNKVHQAYLAGEISQAAYVE
jgi:DNA repair exonuclease SbcCD ATPase subunit